MKSSHLLLAISLAGCAIQGTVTTTGGMTVVYQEPPQPKIENMPPRPGYVWVSGHWGQRDGHWMWIRGRYERERPGSRWQEGRWERRGSGWYWIEGTWVGGAIVVSHQANANADYPIDPPPAPRSEDIGPPRENQIWIAGHWQWKDGAWDWVAGRWEPERPGEVWSPGRWERQGSRWIWIEGRWGRGDVVTSGGATDGPTEEPPPPQAESYGTNKGHVWIPGRWEWKRGTWAWQGGRWEKERRNQVWQAGTWERRGTRWVWIEGRWIDRR